MLKRLKSQTGKATGGRFAIVASEYNARYVDAMLRAARLELKRGGAASIEVVRVPGAFEIPLAAARLVRMDSQWSAIICLGVILRGQTTHAQHIGEAVTLALARLQIDYLVPMIHEVLLLENEEQARVRCLDQKFNRGAEAARTATKMAGVMKRLQALTE